MADTILELAELVKRFGGVTAVSEVSFKVSAGQIKAVIGPNGAGKTTMFNVITGIDTPTSGSIRFKEEEIGTLKAYEIAQRGISRTFQNIQVFEHMSVAENVMVGRHARTRTGILRAALQLPSAKNEERQTKQDARDWLEFVGLLESAERTAGSLAFGQHRLLEIARALATEPELLLLDEPAAGLNARETAAQGELILKIREQGVTVLLVEHDMELVMDISDEVVVLDYGERIAEGKPEEIQHDTRVIEAYLGA